MMDVDPANVAEINRRLGNIYLEGLVQDNRCFFRLQEDIRQAAHAADLAVKRSSISAFSDANVKAGFGAPALNERGDGFVHARDQDRYAGWCMAMETRLQWAESGINQENRI